MGETLVFCMECLYSKKKKKERKKNQSNYQKQKTKTKQNLSTEMGGNKE